MKTFKKALSIILGAAIMLSCLFGMQVSVAAEGTTLDVAVGEATVADGVVSVPVVVTNNPGFQTLAVTVGYDNTVLALTGAVKNAEFATAAAPGNDVPAEVGEISPDFKTIQWAYVAEAVTATGTIATFTFAVVEGATAESTEITLTLAEAWDGANDVTANATAGTVVFTKPCEHEWTIAESTAAVGVAPASGSTDKAGTEESKGSITLTCEKCGHTEDPQEVSYYDDYRPNTLNLDLAAEIKFNFYVTDSRLEGAEEVFFVTSLMIEGANPKVQVLSLEDAPDDTAKSRQIVSTGIPSKFLTDQLVMNVFLKKDGVWYSGRTYSYSVVDAAHLKDGKSTEAEYKMYVALFNFGAKAQTYFNYKTDNLANSAENLGYFADYPLDVEEPAITAQMTNNRGTQGVRFRAYDYNLDAKTILNLKFTVSEATNPPAAEDINVRFTHNSKTYTYGYEELTYETDNDRYIVNFGELTSRQWRDPIIAVVYNGDVAYDCSFETSIAGLMQYSIEKGNAKNDAKLAALYKSMINYGDYADAYFANM